MSLHHLSDEDRALLRAAAVRAEMRRREEMAEPRPDEGMRPVAFVFFLLLTAVVLGAAAWGR